MRGEEFVHALFHDWSCQCHASLYLVTCYLELRHRRKRSADDGVGVKPLQIKLPSPPTNPSHLFLTFKTSWWKKDVFKFLNGEP